MNLVIGATGVLGSEICRQLRALGLPVRALVRRGSPREAELTALGVEIAHGDLRVPATIEMACRGVACVFSTATAMGSKDKRLTLRIVDGDGQQAVVAAAKASGVKRFVFVSVGPNLPSAPLTRYKWAVERAVRDSGMRWTILQPSVFMEIWLGPLLGWNHAAGEATIFGAGNGRMNWVSVRDVASVAIQSLTDPRLENRNVEIGGPEALSPNQAMRIFEEVSGRPYKAKRVPRLVLLAAGPVVSLFNEAVGSGMSLGEATTRDEVMDLSLMRSLVPSPVSVRDYARRVTSAAST